MICTMFTFSLMQSHKIDVDALSGGQFNTKITSKGQVVDSITFNGIKVNAIYRPYDGTNGTDTTYSCAAFVSKFYKNVFGNTVYNLCNASSIPLSNTGSFSKTTSPVVGDIVKSNTNTHWMIVKSISENKITVIQQNAWNSKRTHAWVGAYVIKGDSQYTFFHYSNYKVIPKLTFTYNVNGGSPTIGSQTVYLNKTLTVSDGKSISKAGYVFKGWYAYRTSDSKYYITKKGWYTNSEISKNKYTKKVFTPNTQLVIDNSWISNNTKNTSFQFIAVWEKVTVGKGKTPTLTNSASKKLTIKYEAVSQASGYQIQYATNKKMTNAITKTLTAKSATYTVSKWKTYYVRVRAYKLDSTGAKIYGSWSNVKSKLIVK